MLSLETLQWRLGKATHHPHPAHFFSELALGSVVIDVDDKRLEASFVGVNGEVLDSFVMTR